MQGIYSYIPETNYVPREYNVAAILLLLFMVLISLVSVLNLLFIISISIIKLCVIHASAAKQMRTELFWVFTQRLVVISYRRFGTSYRWHIRGSRIQGS